MIGEALLHKGDAEGALPEGLKESDENYRLIGCAMAYQAGSAPEQLAALRFEVKLPS